MTSPNINISDLVAFGDAVAGHDGVLTTLTGELIVKPCTSAEIAFYNQALQHHHDLAALMPTYMGSLTIATPEQRNCLQIHVPIVPAPNITLPLPTNGNAIIPNTSPPPDSPPPFGKRIESDQAVVLENLTSGFVKPNVLDIKLGTRLWDDDAPPTKRARLDKVASETTSGSLGYRIAGMRVWRPAQGSTAIGKYQFYNKAYGRSLDSSNVRRAFDDFFLPTSSAPLSPSRRAVIQLCESEVAELELVLASKETRMYSSSILLVYEGDDDALDRALAAAQDLQHSQPAASPTTDRPEDSDGGSDSDSDDEPPFPKIFAAKLIDFAHAQWTPGMGSDENVLAGIRNVRKLLQGLTSADDP